ncbi:hypothetical protein BB8028_0005g05110 [Beauveria bassiana]|uniref:Uncharacterized protein n=1 Tax=Beauveria bassiana TaxID=176275 RepID=A0A2S7YGD0_BEABA|nr:hypothetical protein BB8028_0005g05110 [Beauveria bassiana]
MRRPARDHSTALTQRFFNPACTWIYVVLTVEDEFRPEYLLCRTGRHDNSKLKNSTLPNIDFTTIPVHTIYDEFETGHFLHHGCQPISARRTSSGRWKDVGYQASHRNRQIGAEIPHHVITQILSPEV